MKKKLLVCGTFLVPALTLSGCSAEMGDKMGRAGMNTLMGMGTVFIVLIFIAFIISMFKYISRFEAWLENRRSRKEVQPVSPVIQENEELCEEEEMADDLALAAVITAALAASLETSPDKLIVRSIRRKNTNRW